MGINLVFFALVPILNIGKVAPRSWYTDLMSSYIKLHRGAGNWSFYTTKNGMLNIHVFREDPVSAELTKVAAPRPLIEPHWLVYRGHTDLRFLTVGTSVIDRYTAQYLWLCQFYGFERGVRYHVSVAPYALKETFEFIPRAPRAYKGMSYNIINTPTLPFKVISFICAP